MTYYAHSNDFDKSTWQSIKEHLTNTAELARRLGNDAKISDFAYIAALLHDIGKYSQAFQRRLEGAVAKVDHSTAGAKEIKSIFNHNPIGILLAYCIAGHHGGLLDFGSEIDCESENTLQARLRRKVEDYQAYHQEISISKLHIPTYIPIQPIAGNGGFSLAFFTRMIYSVLVDADFLDTETFMNSGAKPRGQYIDISQLCTRLSHHLEKFGNPKSPINLRRTETLKTCIEKSSEPPGIFKLTVPTGGAKTLSSMAFALNHASKYDLKRVIYVIPYTSIIEQNASVFKECLGNENVLEHHSNFEWGKRTDFQDDETNQMLGKLKLASENWDIPIIVTTNVQFFESLFANRSSRCRKLHNIAKSVIIFDEAQMLPMGYIQPCLYSVYELVKNYGSTAVFCTATQPPVEKFLPKEAQIQELASSPQALFDFYKRVHVKNLGKLTDDELIHRINNQPQVFCIVNTRKHARGLFSKLKNNEAFHLSALMCPAHRKETIAMIKERLSLSEPCCVISTQVIEAGIDVDFPQGYRSISGLDSIIQAAGRVNREGRSSPRGILYVFEPDSSFVKRTPAYIQQGAEVAKNILRNYEDPICIEAVKAYYNKLYDLQGGNSFDARGVLECFTRGNGQFDFLTAAEKFKIIDSNTTPIIVPFNDHADSLLKEIRESSFPPSFYRIRELQPYTVNVYDREYQALLNAGKIDVYWEKYAVLNDKKWYDAKKIGLILPESISTEALYFDG